MNNPRHNRNLIICTCLLSFTLLAACGSRTEKAATPDVDIHTAVATGNEAAMRQHLAAGTDINAADPFGGSSPLITAAVFGKTEMARLLIESGADLEFRNKEGSTALFSARFSGRPELVRRLRDDARATN